MPAQKNLRACRKDTPISFRMVARWQRVCVTEGKGILPVRMELIDVDEERPAVFDAKGEFEFKHLREVIEGMFAFANLSFPEPGEYRLKFYVGDEFLMERALHITTPQ